MKTKITFGDGAFCIPIEPFNKEKLKKLNAPGLTHFVDFNVSYSDGILEFIAEARATERTLNFNVLYKGREIKIEGKIIKATQVHDSIEMEIELNQKDRDILELLLDKGNKNDRTN